MEFGTVKFFDARPEKRFGFIRLEDGEEIFFHFNDGQFLRAGKSEPEFTGSATHLRLRSGEPAQSFRLKDPQPGDKLVFSRQHGYKGPKASPWAPRWLYNQVCEQIERRPPPIVYRVFESMNSLGDPQGEPKLLWEGSDIDELLKRYPVPSGRQSPGSDSLIPYYSDSDNIFETRHWFEKQLPDGTWELCPDPRPLSGAGRQFERITRRW